MNKDSLSAKTMGWSDMSSLMYQTTTVPVITNSSDKRTRNPNWTDGEITRFLEILMEEPVLRDLKEQRNKQVFCYVSRKMYSEGSEKAWDQCKIKLKNLKSQWRFVRDRVPLLETTDLENEAEIKKLVNECQASSVSPFCIKHLRALKRFLDSMSAMKRDQPLPVYGPLEPILPSPSLKFPLEQRKEKQDGEYLEEDDEEGEEEEVEISPVDIMDARVKTEEEEEEDHLIVDFPGDKAEDAEVTNGLADATPGAATAAAKPPKSLATITRISQGKTNSVILSPKDEPIIANHQDMIKSRDNVPVGSVWVKSPSLINGHDLNTTSVILNTDQKQLGLKRKRQSYDDAKGSKLVCMNDLAEADGATGGLGVEDRQVRTEEARLSLLARLQENLADKFLRFQKESDIRHLNFEREQIRLEQSFLEKWRLEQQALMDRRREEQRNHDREMLNIFSTFLSQTNKLFTNNL